MPSLTSALTAGTVALLAVPLLILATPGASPGCAGLTPQPGTAQPTLASAMTGRSPSPMTAARTPGPAPAGTSGAGTTSGPVWDAEQRAVAATIVTVGQSRGMPPRALVIALATAMQESQLRNLPGGDADSIGVFQQRPSAGWGTPAQLASPAYQAGAFYTALAVVPGWQTMPLTQAAQAVQRSAHPDAYAKWAAPALTLYQHVGSTNSRAIPEDLEQFVSTPGCAFGGGDGLPNGAEVKLPAGFALPPGTPAQVATAVTWALGQLGTPYSYGGDCTAAHSGDPRHECDCSSLVQKAFEAAGIDLPRTTGGQVTVGTPVPDLATIRAGDLVFIPGSDPRETPASPGHVGLAISYDLIIQAPHSHARVQITRIADWARSVTAARRIVK